MQPLDRELRSYMPRDAAKTQKKKIHKKGNLNSDMYLELELHLVLFGE